MILARAKKKILNSTSGKSTETEQPQTTFTSLTLLRRIGDASDSAAWEQFVDRYAPKIFSWCKRNLLQDSDAADVTQEVLTKLVTTMASFQYDRNRGTFRGWLRTVTTNTIRDIGRRRKTVQLDNSTTCPFDRIASPESVDALTESIEQTYRNEILEQASQIVQLRVQPKTWKAFELSSHQNLSAAQTAEKLNIKISDVYVSKSRVLKLLKEVVSQLEQQQEN